MYSYIKKQDHAASSRLAKKVGKRGHSTHTGQCNMLHVHLGMKKMFTNLRIKFAQCT